MKLHGITAQKTNLVEGARVSLLGNLMEISLAVTYPLDTGLGGDQSQTDMIAKVTAFFCVCHELSPYCPALSYDFPD